jgi:Mrp family chromosome partitioning ATPase
MSEVGGISPSGGGSSRKWWHLRRNREAPRDAVTQAYQRLAMQVNLDLGAKEGGRSIMLTSPHGGDVCCEPTLELAWYLAQEQGQRVLIVDGSVADQELTRAFGCTETSGLLDLLTGVPEEMNGLLRPTRHDFVTFLAAGESKGAGRSVNLGNLAACLERLQEEYDYVLIHAPAILSGATALAFPALVDCVLLLAVEGESRLDDLGASRDALSACKARKIGLVLTVPGPNR